MDQLDSGRNIVGYVLVREIDSQVFFLSQSPTGGDTLSDSLDNTVRFFSSIEEAMLASSNRGSAWRIGGVVDVSDCVGVCDACTAEADNDHPVEEAPTEPVAVLELNLPAHLILKSVVVVSLSLAFLHLVKRVR